MATLDDLGPSFRTADALALGLSARELARLVDDGLLVRRAQGVYAKAVGELPERKAARRQLLDELAVLGPEWHAARRSAALLLDVPLLGRLPARPQLLRDAAGTKGQAVDRFRQVGRLPPEHRTTIAGVRSVTAARFAVDLARTESFRSGLVVVDAVLGTGVAKADLEAVLGTMPRWPGVRQARHVLALADGLSESALESLSRLVFDGAGLPRPMLQVEIYLGDEYLLRADKLWVEQGVVGEDDGLAKFGANAISRQSAFMLTKATQDKLESAGLMVTRWGWDDAFRHGEALAARVSRVLEAPRLRPLDPRLRFVATTVADRVARQAYFRSRSA